MLGPPSSGCARIRAALSPNSLGQPLSLCSVLSHSPVRGVLGSQAGPPPPAGQHPINPHIKSSRADKEVGTFSLRGGLGTLLPFWGTRNLPKAWAPSPAPGPSPGSPRQKAALHEKNGLAWPYPGTQRGGSPCQPGLPLPPRRGLV